MPKGTSSSPTQAQTSKSMPSGAKVLQAALHSPLPKAAAPSGAKAQPAAPPSSPPPQAAPILAVSVEHEDSEGPSVWEKVGGKWTRTGRSWLSWLQGAARAVIAVQAPEVVSALPANLSIADTITAYARGLTEAGLTNTAVVSPELAAFLLDSEDQEIAASAATLGAVGSDLPDGAKVKVSFAWQLEDPGTQTSMDVEPFEAPRVFPHKEQFYYIASDSTCNLVTADGKPNRESVCYAFNIHLNVNYNRTEFRVFSGATLATRTDALAARKSRGMPPTVALVVWSFNDFFVKTGKPRSRNLSRNCPRPSSWSSCGSQGLPCSIPGWLSLSRTTASCGVAKVDTRTLPRLRSRTCRLSESTS